MGAVFGITNSAALTQTFIPTTTLRIAPAITTSSLVRGSTAVTLQDANRSGSALLADVRGRTVFTIVPGDSMTLNSVHEVVPEPTTRSLALVGRAGLALYGRKHRA